MIYHHVHFNSHFSDEPGLARSPSDLFLCVFWNRSIGDKWHMFVGWLSFISLKQQHQSTERNTEHTDPNLWHEGLLKAIHSLCCMSNITHAQPFYGPFFCDCPGALVPEEIFFWTLIRSRHADNQWPSSPIFMPDALPATTLPTYRGLGQAPNMLAWLPSAL